MDSNKFSDIGHHDHVIASPVSSAKIDEIIAVLRCRPDESGSGYWLRQGRNVDSPCGTLSCNMQRHRYQRNASERSAPTRGNEGS